MSPLRLTGSDPLPLQATAIADNVVAALLDINENQIFQSSRRYLYHAVIGALALAAKQDRRAKFEDVYSLLLPKKADFRDAVYQACADTPDLDQTAEFFRTELPQDLELAGSATAQRLDAPRNKVSLLTGVPPLRRFFNHTSDIALGDIIDARDILIVDANMAAIGAENSKACMHFVLRMLHTQLQRQVRRPEADRPRVALLADEAHYLASAENVVDQIATHRAAGLDVTFGLQYLAQLGSGSEHQREDPQGHHQPAPEPLPVPARRPRGRRGGHPDRDGRLLDDDPRRPRLARAHARHARAGPQPPRPLLPRLLDRRRLPRRQLHRRDLPVPARDLRRVGAHPPRAPRRRRSARTRRRWPRRSSASPRSRRRDRRRRTGASRGRSAADGRRAPRRPAAAATATAPRDRPPSAPATAAHASGRAATDAGADRRHAGRACDAHRSAAAEPARRAARARADAASWPPARCAASSGAARADPTPTSRAGPAPASLRELAFIDRINEIKRAQHKPPAEPASRACTTRTTRSSPCSTAPGSSCPR